MSASPVLAILTDSHHLFRHRPYLVKLIIPRWQALGFRVTVIAQADKPVPADVALLHVDLSVVPNTFRSLVKQYPYVINGAVLDIRKRRFSQLIVNREGADPGPVIVKTDRNYGGLPEIRHNIVNSPAGPELLRKGLVESVCQRAALAETKRSWSERRILPIQAYAVYPDRSSVPPGVWENPNLIVERFVAEREGDFYVCRHWIFFGDREVNRLARSTNPVVKATESIQSISDPIPAELRAIRKQFGFDYGKFDYGVVDGKTILYDINPTPGATSNPQTHARTIEVLTEGVLGFLDRRDSHA